MLDVHFFDRYFLPLLPFVLVVLFTFTPTPFSVKHKSVALGILMIMATFSVGATHDYLSWNRARWKALTYLTGQLAVSPNEINGGFEFNGWHRPVKERTYGQFKSWWWVDQENFLITFGPMDGFHEIGNSPFDTYLPPGTDSIYILKKNGQ